MFCQIVFAIGCFIACMIFVFFAGRNYEKKKMWEVKWEIGLASMFEVISIFALIGLCGSFNRLGFENGMGRPSLISSLKPGDTFESSGEPSVWYGDKGMPSTVYVWLYVNHAVEPTGFKLNEIPPKRGKVAKVVNSKDGTEHVVLLPVDSEFAKLGEEKEKPNPTAEKSPEKPEPQKKQEAPHLL